MSEHVPLWPESFGVVLVVRADVVAGDMRDEMFVEGCFRRRRFWENVLDS